MRFLSLAAIATLIAISSTPAYSQRFCNVGAGCELVCLGDYCYCTCWTATQPDLMSAGYQSSNCVKTAAASAPIKQKAVLPSEASLALLHYVKISR